MAKQKVQLKDLLRDVKVACDIPEQIKRQWNKPNNIPDYFSEELQRHIVDHQQRIRERIYGIFTTEKALDATEIERLRQEYSLRTNAALPPRKP